uniref:Putative ovule protein n=1 Tax=Solanum chacoense TaxID=4108 RepID=A0A0V0HCC2_SOLCH
MKLSVNFECIPPCKSVVLSLWYVNKKNTLKQMSAFLMLALCLTITTQWHITSLALDFSRSMLSFQSLMEACQCDLYILL